MTEAVEHGARQSDEGAALAARHELPDEAIILFNTAESGLGIQVIRAYDVPESI